MNRLATSEAIDQAIDTIAIKILDQYNETPLFVALLRGAAPFASKLMFAIARKAPNFHPELDYMMVSTYGSGQTAGEPRIVTDLAPDTITKDREIIILDDVLDKGITANFVFNHLKSRGAASVKLAVLAVKTTNRRYQITPEYAGFSFDDVWLSGMGMDDGHTAKEADRWLSDIYQV